jgi:hypothetical protein
MNMFLIIIGITLTTIGIASIINGIIILFGEKYQ